jgi:hypothetical protein
MWFELYIGKDSSPITRRIGVRRAVIIVGAVLSHLFMYLIYYISVSTVTLKYQHWLPVPQVVPFKLVKVAFVGHHSISPAYINPIIITNFPVQV